LAGGRPSISAIECVELTKVYNSTPALQNLTLDIEYGKSFGLLGENGAGKSTFVRLIMGFIFPSSGQLRVLGETDVVKAHTRIGYVHERPIFDPRFSGHKYLIHLGKLIGLHGAIGKRRVDEVLERVKLQEAAHRAVGGYSKGMQQRLAIAQTLLTNPDLLVLDEPTSGLDPRSQWEIRQLILGLREEGKTLLLCSHYMTEVEALCDTIGIIRKGQMILSGAVHDLVTSKNVVEIVVAEHLDIRDIVTTLGISVQAIIDMQANSMKIQGEAQQEVLDKLVQARVPIVSLSPLKQTLEDVYVQVTNEADEATKPRSLSASQGGH